MELKTYFLNVKRFESEEAGFFVEDSKHVVDKVKIKVQIIL